jgi:hypothetical protein
MTSPHRAQVFVEEVELIFADFILEPDGVAGFIDLEQLVRRRRAEEREERFLMRFDRIEKSYLPPIRGRDGDARRS